MVFRILKISLAVLCIGVLVSYDVPKNWIVAGSKP